MTDNYFPFVRKMDAHEIERGDLGVRLGIHPRELEGGFIHVEEDEHGLCPCCWWRWETTTTAARSLTPIYFD